MVVVGLGVTNSFDVSGMGVSSKIVSVTGAGVSLEDCSVMDTATLFGVELGSVALECFSIDS